MNFSETCPVCLGGIFCGHCALHMTVLVKSACEYLKMSLTAVFFIASILKAGTLESRMCFRMGLPNSIWNMP